MKEEMGKKEAAFVETTASQGRPTSVISDG